MDKSGTKNDKQIKKLRDEWKELPPNHILLIQNLEKFDDLKIYFEKFAGFDNVRLVKVKIWLLLNLKVKTWPNHVWIRQQKMI